MREKTKMFLVFALVPLFTVSCQQQQQQDGVYWSEVIRYIWEG